MSAEKSSESVERPFTSVLREAVNHIGADGRLRASDARALRRALRNKVDKREDPLAEPDAVLGPFDSLPPEGQQALVEAVAQDNRWRMALYNLGAWHAPVTRVLRRLTSRLPRGHLVGQLAEMVGAGFQVGPAWAFHAAYRRCLNWSAKLVPRPRLAAVLAAAGAEVRDLGVRYARGVPQLPAYRGFWHDPSSLTTVGLLVGVDLIRSSEGYWFIESNMDCGLTPARTSLYPEDPFVRNLLDFTETHGYRRLVLASGSAPPDAELARQLREKASARSLAVTILEDGFRSGSENNATEVPEFDSPKTILIRNRHYRTSIDYVVQHKRASSRALRIYKQESGDSSFLLPTTSSEPCVGPADPTDPFPNLVFKLPELDLGQGVFFLKVASASQAREVLAETLRAAPTRSALSRLYSRLEDQQGLYQPYVCGFMVPERRLYKIRAYVLLTPVGAQFLSANRMVGGTPVPETLPMGVVRDQRPFLVSLGPGSRFEVLPAEEEAAVREAALGVARGLSRAISYGFETGPTIGGGRSER